MSFCSFSSICTRQHDDRRSVQTHNRSSAGRRKTKRPQLGHYSRQAGSRQRQAAGNRGTGSTHQDKQRARKELTVHTPEATTGNTSESFMCMRPSQQIRLHTPHTVQHDATQCVSTSSAVQQCGSRGKAGLRKRDRQNTAQVSSEQLQRTPVRSGQGRTPRETDRATHLCVKSA